MRSSLRALSCLAWLITALVAGAQEEAVDVSALPAVQTLLKGKASYLAGDYPKALEELSSAAEALTSPQQAQKYVATGRYETLGYYEIAQVYLALAFHAQGRDDLAREAIVKIVNAEKLEPHFAQLQFEPAAAAFPQLAATLLPDSPLPVNSSLTSPAPTTAVAVTAPPSPPSKSCDELLAAARAEHEAQLAAMRQDIERIVNERVAAERSRIERESEARIAAARAEIDQTIESRVAEEVAKTRETVNTAEAERIAADRAASERAAAAEAEALAAAQRRAEEETRQLDPRVAAMLREAETLVQARELDRADQIYTSLSTSGGLSRPGLSAVAAGLYRTGNFREALRAFQQLGAARKGEEDLRYYYAVVLYETGHYQAAQKELACALPFIEMTDSVARYKAKIEGAAGVR